MLNARNVLGDGEDNQKILKVVSRNGVSDILFSLGKGPKRFSQLMFDTHLNPGILDRHLKALMQLNIVEKRSEVYVLTKTGTKILEIIEQLFTVIKAGNGD